MTRFSFMAFVLSGFLIGCVSGTRAPIEAEMDAKALTVKEGLSGIYIYRPSNVPSMNLVCTINLDDQYVGGLGNGNFLLAHVKPGSHRIQATTGGPTLPDVLLLTTEANQNYFVEAAHKFSDLNTNKTVLTLVDDSIGREKVEASKLVVWAD